MRPHTLDEFIGQAIVRPGKTPAPIQADQLSSVIFYGPPGTGKTTTGPYHRQHPRAAAIAINAVLAGVGEIRPGHRGGPGAPRQFGQRTILFVDEVHRFNKAQQDALLPWVENGTVILIGATTENPYFEVNKALVSRSRIFQLKPLTEEDLFAVARQALADPERGYGKLNVQLDEDALAHLVDVANGDARGVLNALELAVETTEPGPDGVIRIDLAVAEESIQRRAVLYDKEGDVHYDTISAFIKSLRGSDPDAALYWMARMVYAGEDPRFIFRRMIIFAGEDVGMADPHALQVVMACSQAFDYVGMPEGRFHLGEAALYLATAPKSNSGFAFFDALGVVEQEREAEVPAHLRDANRDKEGFGHGEGYLYPHAYRDHWVAQQYLPDALQGRVFYQPGGLGYEARVKGEVERRREAQLAAMLEGGEGFGATEALTFTGSLAAGDRDRWLARVISGAGDRLASLRDRVIEAARLQRHSLVLDINAGTGLLTWEALRRAPGGGAWLLTPNADEAAALREMVARLSQVERPVVLRGRVEELPELLELRDEAGVRFDAVIGRSALAAASDKAAVARVLAEPAGRGRHAQPGRASPAGRRSGSTRWWTWRGWSAALAAKVRAAEEAIYTDPADPLVNWTAADLAALWGPQG